MDASVLSVISPVFVSRVCVGAISLRGASLTLLSASMERSKKNADDMRKNVVSKMRLFKIVGFTDVSNGNKAVGLSI